MLEKDEYGIPWGHWFRTCDNCGNHQTDREPDCTKELTAIYIGSKCNSCRLPSLDFGTQRFPESEDDYGSQKGCDEAGYSVPRS